jgi:hypothetical protein
MKTKISPFTAVMIALAIALLFVVVGCAQFKTLTAQPPAVKQDIAGLCDVFDVAMPLVAQGIRTGLIPESDWAAIDKAIAFATPICTAQPEPSSLGDAIYAELVNATNTLAAGQAKSKAKK